MKRIRVLQIDDPAALGDRLRQAREQAGVSLRQLSFPGCTAPYISAIEHGRRVPSLQVLQVLAQRLGVSVDLLTTGQASPVGQLLVDAEVALRIGESEAAERAFAQALASAREPADQARALTGLGELSFHEGDVENAIELLEHAETAAGGDVATLPQLVETLARAYATRGRYESGIALLERARTAALERGDRITAMRFTVLLANAYVDVGDVGRSAGTLAEALRETAELRDPLLRARVDWSQSRLHTLEGRHDLAAEFAEKALTTLRVAEDDHAVARAQQVLAYIELERGRAEEALALLDDAEPVVSRSSPAVELAVFRLERARALVQLGRLDEAREIALDVAPTLLQGARGDTGRCFVVLGDVFAASSADDEALAMYDAAVESLDGHRSPHLVQALRQKASVLERLGRTDEALAALKQAVATADPASVRR